MSGQHHAWLISHARALATVVLFALLGFPVTVGAHAEEPNSQNVFAIEDGWVLRANVGIVRSSNPHELICEEAFLGGDGWLLAALGPTEWVTFGETKVMRTEDGCDFEEVFTLSRVPSGLSVHRGSGSIAFVMNGVEDENGLWVSTDRGQTFQQIQTFDSETEQTTDVRFIDESTVFVSGYSRADNGAGLAWSVDTMTGEATPITLPADVTYPYVLDASPTHALLLGRRGEQIVFWGPIDDLGQNEYIASTWPSGARLSDDGQNAWIAGTLGGKGVAVGTLDDQGVASWESVAEDTTAGCVEPVGDDIFMCGLGRIDDYDILAVTPQRSIEGVLDFREFEGVRSDCPSDTEVGTVCPRVWPELAPYFGIDVPDASDAGADAGDGSDAGNQVESDGSTEPPVGDEPSDGCCSTVRPTPATSLAALLLLIGLIVRRRH